MGKMRRGIVNTVSLVLIATALLFFLASISLYTNSMKSTDAELVKFEDTNMQFDSASNGARTIELVDAANITTQNGNITFIENFTNLANYSVDITTFSQFIHAYSSPGNVYINISDAKNPNMVIQPQNINVTNKLGNVTFTPQNVTSAKAIGSYDVLLIANRPVPTLKWVMISQAAQNDTNAVYFHIGFQGTNGVVSNNTYLGKYNSSELMLVNSTNQSIVTITLQTPATLSVNYDISMNINSRLTIGLDSIGYVELGNNIVNVSGSIQKTGKVILVES